MNTKFQKSFLLRLFFTITLVVVAGIILAGFFMPVAVNASHGIGPESVECQIPASESVITTESLSVLTLNLAHGRKDALNQMLQKTSTKAGKQTTRPAI